MRFPHIAVVSVFVALLAFPLLAQSPNGTINGLVLDPSNKAVAGAEILVINDATGVKYSSKTNNDGIYVAPNLPPGPYRLQVSKAGFKTLIKPDIVLNVQDALSINFTLPVGAVFEIVTVEGGVSMINTTDASVSTVVDHTYVENMPLNGRSFQDLILLTPGVVTQTPQVSFSGNSGLGLTGEFSINGQRTESNYYTVDGVSANLGAGPSMNLGAGPSGSVAASTALGTTQALVSVDSLQEFRVQSSTYAAEYGRNPGGQFAFETKSGTNQWHGTAYDYLRNGFFDANDWFNDYFNQKQPAIRQNDFGGTLGAPVRIPGLYNGKDKTFFFFSYEGLRLTAPQAATVNFVPDATLRSTAPTALQPVLNAFPVPNGADDTANGIAQYIASFSNPASLDATSVRFDHVVSDKLRFFFRFGQTNSNSASRASGFAITPSVNLRGDYALRTYTAGTTSVFTSHLSNEFRLNYSSNEQTGGRVIDPIGGSTPVNLQQLAGAPGGAIQVLLDYGGYFTDLLQVPSSNAQRQWNFVDSISLALGRHQFKFGADHRRLAPRTLSATPTVDYFYYSESSVHANNASTAVFANAPAYPLYLNFSAFGQDEWRVSPRLGLSFGLRWEVNPAPGVTRGLKPYTVQGSGPDNWIVAPQGAPLWKTTWYNFAPRLGVAYIAHTTPGWETVGRGGGGVFYDTGQQLGSLGFTSVGFGAFSGFQTTSFPAYPAVPAIVNPPVAPYDSITYGFARHLQLPYTVQWNASIEQALGKSQSFTASYVGSHAARLLQLNQFSGANNPNMPNGSIFIQDRLTSDFNSLQFRFQRRLSRGLTALGSYTWSHCIDYGSENYSFGYQRGNCDFDVRHNLSAAFSYDLPSVGHNGFANVLLHDWGGDVRLSARSGFPVTLVGNDLVQPNGQIYHAGLDLVPGQAVYLYGANCAAVLQGLGDLHPGQGCPGGRAINPNAFNIVNSGLGDAPRNFARGFNAWQISLVVRREFPIYESLKLQFRAEGFNVFNHPSFGTIDSVAGSPTFGQATATLANSLGILSPLYQMGGPRSMQFALKLVF